MITLEKQINREDISHLSNTLEDLIYHSLGNYQFLHILSSFLEGSINISNFSSPKDKLDVINFLDKMNRYREDLEVKTGKLTIEDLKIAANRFGNKAQSAFDTELE
jgi:hypothetical protein